MEHCLALSSSLTLLCLEPRDHDGVLGFEESLARRKGLHLERFLALLLQRKNHSFFADSVLDGIHLLHELVNAFTLRLLAVRSGKQTRGFLMFVAIKKVHFPYVKELQSVHAVVDMRLTDNWLQFILLLVVTFPVALILFGVCIGLEVSNEVFSADQPKIFKR